MFVAFRCPVHKWREWRFHVFEKVVVEEKGQGRAADAELEGGEHLPYFLNAESTNCEGEYRVAQLGKFCKKFKET